MKTRLPTAEPWHKLQYLFSSYEEAHISELKSGLFFYFRFGNKYDYKYQTQPT